MFASGFFLWLANSKIHSHFASVNFEPWIVSGSDSDSDSDSYSYSNSNSDSTKKATVLVSDWLPVLINKSTETRSWREPSYNKNWLIAYPLSVLLLTTGDAIKCPKLRTETTRYAYFSTCSFQLTFYDV